MTTILTKTKPPITVRNADTARRLLVSRKATPGRTWRWLAQNVYWPVPPGTLYAIAGGFAIPNKYCHVFKLPPVIKIEACPLCGIVHTYDCQTQAVTPRDNGKPKPPPRKRFRPELPADITDEQRAAVLALTPDERLRRLIDGR